MDQLINSPVRNLFKSSAAERVSDEVFGLKIDDVDEDLTLRELLDQSTETYSTNEVVYSANDIYEKMPKDTKAYREAEKLFQFTRTLSAAELLKAHIEGRISFSTLSEIVKTADLSPREVMKKLLHKKLPKSTAQVAA